MHAWSMGRQAGVCVCAFVVLLVGQGRDAWGIVRRSSGIEGDRCGFLGVLFGGSGVPQGGTHGVPMGFPRGDPPWAPPPGSPMGIPKGVSRDIFRGTHKESHMGSNRGRTMF